MRPEKGNVLAELDCEEIYEACQRYRHCPFVDQPAVIEAYHNMLEVIAQKILDHAFRPAEDV